MVKLIRGEAALTGGCSHLAANTPRELYSPGDLTPWKWGGFKALAYSAFHADTTVQEELGGAPDKASHGDRSTQILVRHYEEPSHGRLVADWGHLGYYHVRLSGALRGGGWDRADH